MPDVSLEARVKMLLEEQGRSLFGLASAMQLEEAALLQKLSGASDLSVIEAATLAKELQISIDEVCRLAPSPGSESNLDK